MRKINNGTSKYDKFDGLNNFLLRLNDYNSDYEYISGYVNDNSKVLLRCRKCGDIIERYANGVRRKRFKCFNCIRLENERKNNNKIIINQFKKEFEKLKDSEQLSFFICKHCGSLFVPTNYRSTKFCSKRCAERHHGNQKSRKRIKVAKNNGFVDNDITLDKLIKRDNNKCYLCGGECNLNDFIIKGNQKITGNYYPSIDHVVAIANGGTHTWDNIKLAHRICNSKKSNKILFT